MNREAYKSYKKSNPYHVWVELDNGRKFVGHFKNRADAQDYARRAKGIRIGNTTTASVTPRKRRARDPFNFNFRF